MEEKMIIGIQEKPSSIVQWLVLSLQHVFAMFGATVLVPILTGLDIGVALVASGVGTLIYIACTKGKVPVYLGSSFAYIGAISVAGATNGFSSAYVGLMVVGMIYAVVATTIRFTGTYTTDASFEPTEGLSKPSVCIPSHSTDAVHDPPVKSSTSATYNPAGLDSLILSARAICVKESGPKESWLIA